jgi:DNA gyrase subunit A
MEIKYIDICDELKQNFIDFAYEANSQRAFPDARDGLKPGQRACLWEFFTKGYLSNKPHVKCAKVAGGVIATWWPHGDVAIYETFARMSQPWINNLPEVDWHGSNGNIVIGSVPASSRYTEARLNKAIEDGMFGNIKKNVVPMVLNFSEDDEWPEVLPAIFPRLLVNGSQGIGVTVAQSWIPHNLTDLTEVISKYVDQGVLDYSNLAPDFPTGGIIINKNELNEIYATGKGRAIVRAKTEIKGNTIMITELPYQVYVEPLIEEIKDLIQKEEITGIEEIYNKTDKKRLLIEIECNSAPLTVLNKLFASTNLQKSFSANQMALVSKTPKMLNLKNYLDIYINHNIDCIRKEYVFDLEKAQARLEIVNGLLKALEDIDNIITLIKNSDSAAAAKANLQAKYQFTENQAKAIVDMKLGRLAHLEYIELNEEKADLTKTIEYCTTMINDSTLLQNEFLVRLSTFTKKYGTPRKTAVTQVAVTKEEKEIEFVEPEKCVVIMTEGGLVKRVPSANFRTQKRNGKGVKTQDDITHAVIRTNTVDSLMIFTNQGKMYRLLVNDIPEGTNTTKGQSIKNLVVMEANEEPAVIYSIYRDTEAKYVLFVTKNGLVKKTALEEYVKTKKKTGIAAINLKDGDELAAVSLVKDENLILVTSNGMSIKFDSKEIGPTSRTTSGIKGITLAADDYVVAALPVRNSTDQLAIFSQNGLGKKFSLSELPLQKRAGKGLLCYKPNDTTGKVAAASLIEDTDNILILGDKSSICIEATDVPTLGRASVGNQIIKNNKILSVSKV